MDNNEIGKNMIHARKALSELSGYPLSYEQTTNATISKMIKSNKPKSLKVRSYKTNNSYRMLRESRNQNIKILKNIDKKLLLIASSLLLIPKILNKEQAMQTNKPVKFEDYKKGELQPSGPTGYKISKNALSKLKSYESFKDKAYKLPGEKYWTIGYGHNGPDVSPYDKIDRQQAEQLLAKDLNEFEYVISKNVKVPLTQNMFDALVMFTYNVGIGAFLQSTLLKKLNSGDYEGAKNEFYRWNKGSNKQVLEGLVNRRKYEAELFGKDITKDNKINQPKIKEKKNYEGKSTTQSKTSKDIGKYVLQNNKVKLSENMKAYLKSVGGSGVVTSSLRKHVPGQRFEKSHASGNKVDIGLGGLTQEEVIKTAVPFMKHPATVHVAFECLGRSNKESIAISKNIVNIIYARYPDIKKRVQNGNLLIYHWGWQYGNGPHLDILMSPNKLGLNKTNAESSKNVIKATHNSNNAILPTTKRNIVNDSKQVPTNKNISIENKPTSSFHKGKMNTINPILIGKNTNTRKKI